MKKGDAFGVAAAGLATVFGPSATPSISQKVTFSDSIQPIVSNRNVSETDMTDRVTQLSIDLSEAKMSAKIDAVELRTETKFAQLMGKMELLVDSIGDLKENFKSLDTKIGTVGENTKIAKRDILIAVVAGCLALAGLSFAAVTIHQASLAIGIDAAKGGASVGTKK